MKNNYFTLETVNNFKNQNKVNKIVSIIFGVLFTVSFVLSIVLATYQKRYIFMIFGSLISSILLIIFLIFIFKTIYFANFIVRYEFILNSKSDKNEGVLINVSDTITLINNDKVKELTFKINDSNKKFYLLDLGQDSLDINKNYIFYTVEDYIKEISDEN